MSLGTLSLDLVAKTAPFERGLKRAQTATQQFASKSTSAAKKGVMGLTGALGKLGSAFTSLPAAMGLAGGAAGIGGLAAFSIKAAADLEATTSQFETMLGSAEKADKVVSGLFDFSKKTPFEPTDVFGAARSLLAGGFEEESLAKNLQLIGDVSAVSGSRIQELAAIFAEIRSKGKADAGDFRQFTTRGINLLAALQEALGKTAGEINDMRSKGVIGINEITAAFEVLTSEGGVAFGAMERQSKTLSGLFSTLKGNIDIAFAKIGEGAVAGGKLKDAIEATNKILAETDWDALGQAVADGFKSALVTLSAIDEIVTDLRVAANAGPGGAGLLVNRITKANEDFNPFLSQESRDKSRRARYARARQIGDKADRIENLEAGRAARRKAVNEILNASERAAAERAAERLRLRQEGAARTAGGEVPFNFAGFGNFSPVDANLKPIASARADSAIGRALATTVADSFKPVAQAVVDVIERGAIKAGGTDVGRSEAGLSILKQVVTELTRVRQAIKEIRVGTAPRI